MKHPESTISCADCGTLHKRKRKRINLALQGGGAHGAFTWGVLDALLEDGRLDFEGISGASAGAVNAVTMADGLLRGGEAAGREQARTRLRTVWEGVMAAGSLASMGDNLANMLPFMTMLPNPSQIMSSVIQPWSSPYTLNPLDLNPLRNLLKQEVDFEALASMRQMRLFISATRVASGKTEVFTGEEISLSAVMASACLPQVYQAVEVDGEHYWDGGYGANPPLTPLIARCDSADILLVQLNPLHHQTLPTSQTEIANRVNEITFNANLLAQMRTIGFINRMIDRGLLRENRARPGWLRFMHRIIDQGPSQEPAFKRVHMHRIDGGDILRALDGGSKMSTDVTALTRLFEHGRAQAQAWLETAWDAVGERSSINIERDYADDLMLHA